MKWASAVWTTALVTGMMAQAYIYEIKVLRRWDAQSLRYQYVVGLSDFHDKIHAINKQQLDYLIGLFRRCASRNPKVIIEDISSPGCMGRMTCGRFYVDSRGGILGGLAKICQDAGICHLDNVEYRYCRVISLGPVASSSTTDPATIVSTAAITIGDLVVEVEELCAEVRRYNDGTALNKVYEEILKGCTKEMSRLRFMESKHLSVAAYIARNLPMRDRFEGIKRLLTFDSTLLDAKMLHQLYNFHESDAVLAIAGGAHIARVSDMLQLAGYELIHTSKVTMMHETDLQKCVGCNIIDGKGCLKPCPLDITIVDEYL
ncbi:hypothetical protein KJZ61_01825 [Candidatus Dependentiae bacterium]|nr:hypothetical protein [Candidatus Dependentiae bacterium]